MTMAHSSPLSSVSETVQAIINATHELRQAKDELRSGNLIRGVTRHEQAKAALYHAVNAVMLANISNENAHHLSAFLRASADYKGAYDAYRVSGTSSDAALGLVKAEKKLIQELEQMTFARN